MSSYYSESVPDLDLMLQNVVLNVNSQQQCVQQNGFDTPESLSSPSSSSESKKTVTFEDDSIFTIHDINITVPKVIKQYYT